MTNTTIQQLQSQYTVLKVIDLDETSSMSYNMMQTWLAEQLASVRRDSYASTERIVVWYTQDTYVKQDKIGLLARNLQLALLDADISSCFVVLAGTNPMLEEELQLAQRLGHDAFPIEHLIAVGDWTKKTVDKYPNSNKETYQYGAVNPLKISVDSLGEHEKHLLMDSKVFCIYPWIHLNANPDGKAYPCCMTNHKDSVGSCKTHTLKEIWNNDKMRDVRLSMLNDQPVAGCSGCYEKEKSGFFSGRLSANKHHGHQISRVLETQADGTLDRFEMVYWDIRYSNLCNLRCRSCGHIYSSQWHQDQAQLAGPEWAAKTQVLNYAGRTETDMWTQLEPHLDHVEQIYFAGGEPLLMEEHYNILEELEKRNRFDVRLIYNTNFTHTRLKNRSVFDYWKNFENVSVGASLDDFGARGEYIRKGTTWDKVERNREQMMEICPGVDFYASATLSILNAMHITEFHKNWTDRGFIAAKDFNVNILIDPEHYRIDIATREYKAKLESMYREHIEWLRPLDPLNRATQGYESAIQFMNATDNTQLIDTFWRKTHELDNIRKENILDIIPELRALK